MTPALPHRPGLDGIRALAVAAVLLYHGGVAWAPGGFLGVDVFFVLSGYLITSLLLAERRANGRVDLRAFWLRRARRLLPAVVVVIAAVVAVTAAFLPGELAATRADALASLLYVQNWHLILGDHSYFAAFGRPSPLLHLWSLSIEEQFYLLWPLALGAGLVVLGRGRTAAAVAVAAVASAVLMAALSDPAGDPSRAYFGTDTRATPLLVGALLAFAWPPVRDGVRTGRGAGPLLDAVAVAALAVLALAVARRHDYDPATYRGGLVVVALASAALVAAVAHPATRAGRALGARPLRWGGRRSYGIYLWHWPVMVVTRPGLDVPWSATVLVPLQILVTVALAAASYRWVERPFHTGAAQRRLAAWLDARRPRERLATAGATAAILVLGVAAVAGRPGPSQASPGLRAERTAAAAQPPGAPAAAAPAGPRATVRGPVLAVGASVMLSARRELERRLGPQTRVDAAVGRQPRDVVARLDEYRRRRSLPARVVVQLGENGPVWSDDVRALRRVLRGVRRVVLLTVRVPRSWERESNGAIEAAAAGWPGAVVGDWHAASSRAGLLYDGAHPDVAGQRLYADVVARALSAPPTRPSGSRAAQPPPAAATAAARPGAPGR